MTRVLEKKALPRSIHAISEEVARLLGDPEQVRRADAVAKIETLMCEAEPSTLNVRVTQIGKVRVMPQGEETVAMLEIMVDGPQESEAMAKIGSNKASREAGTVSRMTTGHPTVGAYWQRNDTIYALVEALGHADDNGQWDAALAIAEELAKVLEMRYGARYAWHDLPGAVDLGRLDRVDAGLSVRITNALKKAQREQETRKTMASIISRK